MSRFFYSFLYGRGIGIAHIVKFIVVFSRLVNTQLMQFTLSVAVRVCHYYYLLVQTSCPGSFSVGSSVLKFFHYSFSIIRFDRNRRCLKSVWRPLKSFVGGNLRTTVNRSAKNRSKGMWEGCMCVEWERGEKRLWPLDYAERSVTR